MLTPDEPTSPKLLPRAILFAFIPIQILILKQQGRIWWCDCGRWNPVSLNVNSMHNSQHLIDPYSLSHVLHGLLFFGLLWLMRRKIPIAWRFTLAAAIEVIWELLENSPIIINRYRAATVSLGYSGDSVANSLSDLASFMLGFWIAKKVGLWWSVAIFLATDLFLLWWIRDNLMLNVLMLLWPIDAMRKWQSGA